MTYSVWNRNYAFEGDIFPSSVEIGGKEFLYSPISLKACFGEKTGKWQKIKKIKMDDNQFLTAMESENLIVNAQTVIEDDGFVKVDFNLMSYWQFHEDNVPRLTGLSIDVPIKKEYAKFLHFWPNCESGIVPSHKVLNSFEIPSEGVKLPFKPVLWIGNDNKGLSISIPSSKNFINADKESVCTVEDRGDYINLNIEILSETPNSWKRADMWADNVPVLDYSISFQATPVKEFDKENLKNWRAYHAMGVDANGIVYDYMSGKNIEEGRKYIKNIKDSGANWLVLHEEWSNVQNYGMPDDIDAFKAFMKDCHEIGLKVMVYFGYEYSSLAPDFNQNYNKMLIKNVDGRTVGGWQREPMQRDFQVCYCSEYSDILIDRVKYVMDELGVDGIYSDGMFIPWECANEEHGCGYRDENGELHYTYPIYHLREHVKKLRQVIKERNGLLDAHQSACCTMPVLGFADTYFDGENIQDYICEDIKYMKFDAFRAEFSGANFGLPCNFISYTGDKYTIRMIAGISLLHNVLPRTQHLEDLEFLSKVWKIYDEYDVLSAKWIPYYENTTFITPENVYMSYYERDNDYLFLIVSHNEKVKEFVLDIDADTVIDVIDNNSILENGKVRIPLEYADVKIVRVKK